MQRRGRASDAAMQRRVNQRGGAMPIDWRLLIVGGVLVLGVIVLVIVLVFGGGSAARVGVQQVDDGGGHIQDGSVGGPYSSVPATSGQHWTTPANWGVYTTANPAVESQVIHNLEHGGIVIWYQSTATQDDIDAADPVHPAGAEFGQPQGDPVAVERAGLRPSRSPSPRGTGCSTWTVPTSTRSAPSRRTIPPATRPSRSAVRKASVRTRRRRSEGLTLPGRFRHHSRRAASSTAEQVTLNH